MHGRGEKASEQLATRALEALCGSAFELSQIEKNGRRGISDPTAAESGVDPEGDQSRGLVRELPRHFLHGERESRRRERDLERGGGLTRTQVCARLAEESREGTPILAQPT